MYKGKIVISMNGQLSEKVVANITSTVRLAKEHIDIDVELLASVSEKKDLFSLNYRVSNAHQFGIFLETIQDGLQKEGFSIFSFKGESEQDKPNS